MKYYSTVTKKLYNSEEECNREEKAETERQRKEEQDCQKKAEERELRLKELNEAYKKYITLEDQYLKDYGILNLIWNF